MCDYRDQTTSTVSPTAYTGKRSARQFHPDPRRHRVSEHPSDRRGKDQQVTKGPIKKPAFFELLLEQDCCERQNVEGGRVGNSDDL